MQRVVVLGGLGDVYLVAALYESFCQHHGRRDVELVIKDKHAAVLDLFPGVPYRIDDIITFGTESDRQFQKNYDNVLRGDQSFFAHPCMAKTRIKLDGLPTKDDFTQADIFRLVLGLNLDAPLSLPRVPSTEIIPGTVMVCEAFTWPDTQPGFYPKLCAVLRASARDVWVNDGKLPFKQLFARAAATEWVIGSQCGLMSIFVTGRWPCRKTLATPDIDNGRGGSYWAKSTFPYAYVRKFAGFDFDVEEHKITDDNHRAVIDAIMRGPNALRLWPHDPAPTMTVTVPLTPGDFLDRFAVLTVKRGRFLTPRRAAIDREFSRYDELSRRTKFPPNVAILFNKLVEVHAQTFDLLEGMVPSALDSGIAIETHVEAIKLNRERVELKQAIDAACRSPYTEVKSYYGG